jgi:dTDP-4-amino-4,6-dideoxygalactose transaminase
MPTVPFHPIVDEPVPVPKRWGDAEQVRLSAMLLQGSLFYWNGPQTTALVEEFRRQYPLKYLAPCSSGTAAVHIAVASLRLKPGDEVIVPAITDMGTVIGILYQQAVPVFADLDAGTFTLDPADVRRRVTPKTRAIIAVHLAGNASDVGGLGKIAKEHSLVLIEDCAQAWGACWQGRPVGTIGDIACFSLNDFKHISCGDGGIVGTNDERLGPDLGRWGDKGYDRIGGIRDPQFLAPNYRISEPQAAIGAAQLGKLPQIIERRIHVGKHLTSLLERIPGLILPAVAAGNTHSYWFYMPRLDLSLLKQTRAEIAAALSAEGVSVSPCYLNQPLYKYPVFQNHAFFGGSWPIRDFGLTSMDYTKVSLPETEAIISETLAVRPLNEAWTDAYTEKVAKAFRTVFTRAAR